MREAASRGFWVASRVPYGFKKLMVQDGGQEAPHPGTRPRNVTHSEAHL